MPDSQATPNQHGKPEKIHDVQRASDDFSADLIAFGDESSSKRALDPNVYLLSAVLVHRSNLELSRSAAAPLRVRGQSKPHWRDESFRRHDRVIGVAAGLPLESIVVVRLGREGEHPERRRRKCFERLVVELETRGCQRLVLESRGSVDDRRDRQMLDGLRVARKSSTLRLDHAPGGAEPMLWIADAVCGAVVDARTGDDRWFRRITGATSVVVIDARR